MLWNMHRLYRVYSNICDYRHIETYNSIGTEIDDVKLSRK